MPKNVFWTSCGRDCGEPWAGQAAAQGGRLLGICLCQQILPLPMAPEPLIARLASPAEEEFGLWAAETAQQHLAESPCQAMAFHISGSKVAASEAGSFPESSPLFTELQTGWGWKGHVEVIWSNPLAQAGLPKASYPGLCRDGFWISPRRETPQPSRETFCSTSQNHRITE